MRTLPTGQTVRLNIDEGPATVGTVLRHAIREQDGVQLVTVVWDDAESVDTVPATILTPLCDWEESHPDEYGMACSEPELGVPTTIEWSCHFDAQRVVSWTDEYGPQEMWVCFDHAVTLSLDLQREHVQHTIVPLDPEGYAAAYAAYRDDMTDLGGEG